MSTDQEPDELGGEESTDASLIAAPTDFADRANLPFPVVGIGASAGGLAALRAFLDALKPDSGMAFIVIQHLPPDRESLMASILARHTQMALLQIKDGMRVKPNHVYVIRPGYTVTLRNGLLHLQEPVQARGHRRPVDDFFRSLATEQKEKAIAVVLSGMGTNGTAGAQAIKAAGGLCIAQDPDSAEFSSMPQSLIAAGYADQVLAPGQMGALLVNYSQQPYLQTAAARQHADDILRHEREYLNEIFAILRIHTNHDFTGHKKPTLVRRMQRRLGLLSIQHLREYVAHLREHPDEVQALANDLMINVTGFFRDPQGWEALRVAVIRPLVEQRGSDETIRAWVTACASGEEAYSLAILLADEVARAGKRLQVKIFGTDTADKSLGLARAGIYPGGIEGDVPLDYLDRFFDKEEHIYRVKKDIREMVVFASQDLLRDPPFSRVDLCSCRNLLVYLEPETQQRIMKQMHFALREGGYLFLGNVDTQGIAEQSFETISGKWRIYRRTGPVAPQWVDLSNLSARSLQAVRRADVVNSSLLRPSPTLMVQQALLDQCVPPTIIVDLQDRVVYFHGEISPFLTQPAGEPTRNLFDMLGNGLRPSVREVLRKAGNEKRSASIVDGERHIRITAAPLLPTREAEYLRITFDAPLQNGAENLTSSNSPVRLPPMETPQELALEYELRIARRELQGTIEAFEASNEELKASNEEIISINEELQSANEELEAGKEEVQSLNEELIAANAQLQAKIQETEAATNDLTNLLSSTHIAVVFLDTQLRVRRFTPAISDLLALIPGDIGRPIAHFAPKFSDGDLLEDAHAVLARLIPIESELRSHSGTWYLRRTLPYRTSDNRIDGVVITFVDITARKNVEQALAASQSRLQAVIEQMPGAILLVEAPSGRLILGNKSLARLFGLPFPMPFVGTSWATMATTFTGYHSSGLAYLPEEWPLARTLASEQPIEEEEIGFRYPDGSEGTLLVSSTPIRNADGAVIAAVVTFWDITTRRHAAESLRQSEERCRLLIESAIDYAIFTTDNEGLITSWNSGAERLLGWTEAEAIGRACAMIFTPEDRIAGRPEEERQEATRVGRASDERPHLRKDGSRFWASGILTPLTDGNSEIRGFAKIMRDNTERRAADQKLQKALRESEAIRATVESANQAKDEFISTVSHELRTPLNSIRLWARMLGSGRVPHEEWDEGIRVIDRSALSQQQLIDDLLDVSRMASGKLRLAPRETRLAHAIKGAVQAVMPSAAARKVEINARFDEQVGVVRADPDRIQQVVWNLLTNAVKFTPAGGHVDLDLRRDSRDVLIVVKDTGIGIRADFLPHVFDRFRQAEASTTRQHGGLGLGLAIAKQLVELHGGKITVESEGDGRGAQFAVRLPLPPISGDAAEDLPDQRNSIDEALRRMRVLLLEDDAATREATCRLLELHGADVQAVSTAAAARDAYLTQQPVLMVCDIGLPGEDGFSFIQQIRHIERDQKLSRVPAIAVTAFARTEDRQRALDAGFDEHLPKPLNTDALIAWIQQQRSRA